MVRYSFELTALSGPRFLKPPPLVGDVLLFNLGAIMFDCAKADLNRFKDEGANSNILRVLARGLVSQGFQAIIVYRFFRWFHLRGISMQPFRLVVERFIEITTGISIPTAADIGRGFRIHHFGGIIFHSKVKIGENCTVYQGVTLGDKGGWGNPPTIGNNVLIGAGAKVLGDITIGDNVAIGANAVVLKSIPPNSIAAGIPAKVVGSRKPIPNSRDQIGVTNQVVG